MEKSNSAITLMEILKDIINSQHEKLFASEQMQKANPLGIETQKNWRKESERTNSEGCEKFGWNWITANESAISAASDLGVNYGHPQIKVFIQSIVFAVLDRIPTTNQTT
jgi:hypothetical protein